MFDFGVRILAADTGLPDSRYSFEGRAGWIKTGMNQDPAYAAYPVIVEATCTLSARGGCLAGTLEIVGGGIDWPKLDDGEFVEFYWNRSDPTSLFYSGRIARGAERSGTGNTHKYKLNGAWESLEWVSIDSVTFLGFDEGTGGTGTAHDCATYFLENIMGITGSNVARDIISVGTVDDNSTPVKAITVMEDTKPKEFFETLEFMATGADGTVDTSTPRVWIAGVDHNRVFYFKPLAPGGSPALTVQHGNDHAYRPLVDWNEQVITRLPPGRIRVWGGLVQSGDQSGMMANQIYANDRNDVDGNAVSGQRGVKKPHSVYADTLDSGVDMTYYKAGWFNKFGRKIPFVKNMRYVANEPPRPWDGFVLFKRVNEAGDLVDQTLLWDTAQFSLSNGPVIEIAIGDEGEPRTSGNQGISPVRKMFHDLAGVRDFIYPQLTREDPPVSPAGGGGGSAIVYLIPHSNSDFYDGGARADGLGGR